MMLGQVSMHGVTGDELVDLDHLERSQSWRLSVGTIDLHAQDLDALDALAQRIRTKVEERRQETAISEPAPASDCRGFQWIGQPLTSCDRCGRPAWVHDGMEGRPDDPFSPASNVVPWKPGEAEAIQRKWSA